MLIEVDKDVWTKVCKCHYPKIKDLAWYYTKRGYVEYNKKGLGAMKLHRVIAGTPDGLLTDHINQDPLDNRCCNLRSATKAQNTMNRGLSAANTSGYRGVFYNKQNNVWNARLGYQGKDINLGSFRTAAEAARAWNESAKKHYGDYAWLNPV
jgi:hypothetical protein